MNDKQRMLAGKLYNPYHIQDHAWENCREALEKFHALPYDHQEESMRILKGIFGHLEEDANIIPPFFVTRVHRFILESSFLRIPVY